jgi:hypothetical protein
MFSREELAILENLLKQTRNILEGKHGAKLQKDVGTFYSKREREAITDNGLLHKILYLEDVSTKGV